MATVNDIEMHMVELDIEHEENEELINDTGVKEEINIFELCLVGRFLRKKNISVLAMKSKLADIWKPALGISIKDLNQGYFYFNFTKKRICNGCLMVVRGCLIMH